MRAPPSQADASLTAVDRSVAEVAWATPGAAGGLAVLEAFVPTGALSLSIDLSFFVPAGERTPLGLLRP